MMKAFLWRLLIAIIAVAILYRVIPLLFVVLHFPLPEPAVELILLCIAGLAVFYVFAGGNTPPPPV